MKTIQDQQKRLGERSAPWLAKCTFRKLQVNVASSKPGVQLAGHALDSKASQRGAVTFAEPVSIEAGQILTVT